MNIKEVELYQQCIGWQDEDIIEIRPIPTSKGERRWVEAKDMSNIYESLVNDNNLKANIFIGVLPRKTVGGGKDCNVSRGKVLWCDFDNISQQNAIQQLKMANMPNPTMVVSSGHGFHFYWKLKSLQNPYEISNLARELAIIVGGDVRATNPSRLLRLPGFINHKYEPVPCSIISAEPNLSYDFKELRKLIPHEEHEEKVKTVKAQGKKKKKKNTSNIALLNFASYKTVAQKRAYDLEQLVKIRKGKIKRGTRELFLWQYRKYIAIAGGVDDVSRVLILNSRFTEPLSAEEVETATADSSNEVMPRNETLIRWFEISIEEQYQLVTIHASVVRKELEASKRQKKRIKQKQKLMSSGIEADGRIRNRQLSDMRILNLHLEGLNNSEIALKLNISRRTVIRALRRNELYSQSCIA